MFRNKRLTILAAVCALLVLAIPAALHAAEGETWIVFDCNRPNPNVQGERTYWDIWKLNPDAPGTEGSDLFGIPLTTDPANEWDPTYSVEDQSVVFVSDKSGWPNLWKVSIDGGYPSALMIAAGHCNVDPCYSFDGTKIAFTSNQTGNWEIYTIDADGSNKQQITTDPADDRSPCFSTDGSKIYFISNRDAGQIGDWEIYVRPSDGSGSAEKAIVASNGFPWLLDYTEHDPCCNPSDDDIIVFATNKATPTYTEEVDRINFELWKYSISGKIITRLTESWNDEVGKEMWNSSMPCFSPDGEHIAWSADNWACTGWLGGYEDRPYYDKLPYKSYWKPEGKGQGSHHNIWVRPRDQNDHAYFFPASYWGWDGGLTIDKHHHDMNYNPSWDYQPGKQP